ncbi:SLATT domain-containing protein [Streptomyces sp. B1I3]|uniref:SLATT domain-containing protein n=1 Tax=Streptomyces sp. B1I3 TaxID=3042264 RepID=UPI0027807E1C|nr:SLATT domain-containing protein [Streptomyces sp. B1I3]MDQ0797772.1 hypothetical protein [Streptomyces sp. B1I3]
MTPESDAVPDRDPYLLAQMREAFGRVVFSHKTHEKQADICFTKHRWQQGVLIALTAISTGTFLAAVVGLLGNAVFTSLVTSSIALLVSWMSLGTKTFKFEEESEAHRGIASRLWDVREFYTSLIVGLMSGTLSNAEGRERRDELQQAARAPAAWSSAIPTVPKGRSPTGSYANASIGTRFVSDFPRGIPGTSAYRDVGSLLRGWRTGCQHRAVRSGRRSSGRPHI